MRWIVFTVALILAATLLPESIASPSHQGSGTWHRAGSIYLDTIPVQVWYENVGGPYHLLHIAGGPYVSSIYFTSDISNGGVFLDMWGCPWIVTNFHAPITTFTPACGLSAEVFRVTFS